MAHAVAELYARFGEILIGSMSQVQEPTMPETDKPARPKAPAWMEKANLYYGSAVNVADKEELARAIRDVTELSYAERCFMLAHLLYLNLQAQASQMRLLRDQRDTLDELSTDVGEGLDLLADEQSDEGEG